MKHIIGLDIGQVRDPTAIAALRHRVIPAGWKRPATDFFGRPIEEQQMIDAYDCALLERPQLGTSYQDVVERAVHIATKLEDAWIVVDATGVGRPIVELLAHREGVNVVPVIFTGGDHESLSDGFYRVPKKNLVGAAQLLLQSGRLRVAQSLKLTPVLLKEMENFKIKVNASNGRDSYEAWREGDHDDLVFAVAMAAWWGEKHPTGWVPVSSGTPMSEPEQVMLANALKESARRSSLPWEFEDEPN